MNPRKVLITGANRGIGLELVRQYTKQGTEVLAVIRGEASQELLALKPRIYKCDMSDLASISAMKKTIGDEPLDVVINNAGIYQRCGKASEITDEEYKGALLGFTVNVFGPLKLASLFAENLRAQTDGMKKIIFMTSRMGSIADNKSGGVYFYRATKCALNMVCQSLKHELPDIVCIVQHPGWVKTDMGGAGAPLEPADSVTGIRKVIENETRSGVFVSYNGEEIPW